MDSETLRTWARQGASARLEQIRLETEALRTFLRQPSQTQRPRSGAGDGGSRARPAASARLWPANIDKITQAETDRELAPARVHWTRRPENAAKLRLARRREARTRTRNAKEQ